MSSVINHFAWNITLLRNFHKYSRPHVAGKLGIKADKYKHWEEGHSMPNNACMLITICNLYGYTDLYSLIAKELSDEDLHKYYFQLDKNRNQSEFPTDKGL